MKPQKSDFLPYQFEVMLSAQGLMRLDNLIPDGGGVYSVRRRFEAGQVYKVIGITYEIWEDGSRTLCYLIFDKDGELSNRATQNFVEVKDSTPIKEMVKTWRAENKNAYDHGTIDV